MGAFKAYDIRGIYNVDFDKNTAYKVGYFLPSLLNASFVAVGRDVRVSSDEIHDALLKGITDSGADVYDLGLATTPMVYFATTFLDASASVQITTLLHLKFFKLKDVTSFPDFVLTSTPQPSTLIISVIMSFLKILA